MNHAVLVGYLTREIEIEQLRGGHLAGRTLLAVPRGRHGQGPGADFVPVLVQGRVNVLAAAALRAGDRVRVTGRLAASYADVRAGQFRVVAREVVPLGGGPAGPQRTASARRPYLAVLPGREDLDVRESVPVLDRDDAEDAA